MQGSRYQTPARASAKSLLQPRGSQSGDYFFRFKKPSSKNPTIYRSINEQQLEKWIIQIVVDIIRAKGEPLTFNEIQNSLDPALYNKLHESKALMTFNPRSVEKIMKENIGRIFQLIIPKPKESSGGKSQTRLWNILEK